MRVGGLLQADAEKLVAAAHQVCPYSNATRGYLDVGLEVTVVQVETGHGDFEIA